VGKIDHEEAILERILESVEDVKCYTDKDCVDSDFYRCQFDSGNPRGTCVHKDVYPILSKEIIGLFVFAIIMALSNIAGIGGGGVAVPMIIIFFSF